MFIRVPPPLTSLYDIRNPPHSIVIDFAIRVQLLQIVNQLL